MLNRTPRTIKRVIAATALLSAVGVGVGAVAQAAPTAPSTPVASQPANSGHGQHVLGEPWPADANPPLLYETHEVRDPHGILFVAGQTAKTDDGKTYVDLWNMPAQIDRVIDQVEKYVKDAGYQPSDITNLRYSVTDEDLFVQNFDRVAARLAKDGIKPSSAALGVERLAHPGTMIEIEAVAVR